MQRRQEPVAAGLSWPSDERDFEMISRAGDETANLRVWVVATEAWQSDSLFDEPDVATVLFPAVERCLTRREAEHFVAGFNEQMQPLGGRRWAIARRVRATFEDDLARGQRLRKPGAERIEAPSRESAASVRSSTRDSP
jgi:hypothetical protein